MTWLLRGTVVAVAFLLSPAPALATEEASVAEVIDAGSEKSGERLEVRGELVGDYGHREDGWTWTQVNGDVYVDDPIREGGDPAGGNIGIGARIPTELVTGLGPPGGYRGRGPVVSLTGVWRFHDPERHGESYLQVESLRVIEPARPFDGGVDWTAALVGGILLMGAGAVAYFTGRADGP